MPFFNTQDQQKLVWAPSFALARAYLDQLARSNGLAAETIAAARTSLDTAERRSGSQRKTTLTELATRLTTATAAARDQAKAKLLSTAVSDLAGSTR
jgi:site-specific recombinase XerD